jgi:beta-lactamase superfamily II metal-dependent hydrolase
MRCSTRNPGFFTIPQKPGFVSRRIDVKRIAVLGLTLGVFTAALVAQTPARGNAAAQAPRSAAAAAKPLDIYVLDVEGGKATFFIAPSGQVVLIDTGFPGGRDLERIVTAMDTIGVKKIDYLITTHYHVDHIGSLIDLAKRVPIDTFVDHGPTVEAREQVANYQAQYAEVWGKAKHIVAKPGDKLALTGIDWRIVTSAGNVIKTPLPGGGKPNPACRDYKEKDPNYHGGLENGQSVGSVITYGQFRAVDLGDFLWNLEGQLMCPNNPIGEVDVYFASHHGLDYSGSDALVHGLHPRVSIMQNGPRKGGAPSTMLTMRTSPGMEDLWQSHWGNEAGLDENSAGVFIANVDDNATVAAILTAPPRGAGAGRGGRGGAPGGPGAAPATPPAPPAPGAAAPPALPAGSVPFSGVLPAAAANMPAPAAQAAPAGAPGQPPAPPQNAGPGGRGPQLQNAAHTPAFWIKVSAMPDGSFTVTNGRNGFSKTYTKR